MINKPQPPQPKPKRQFVRLKVQSHTFMRLKVFLRKHLLSVLQFLTRNRRLRAAVFCSMLQYLTVRCNVLQRVATCCSVWCSVLAAWCSVCVATCCIVCCSVLATCCSVSKHPSSGWAFNQTKKNTLWFSRHFPPVIEGCTSTKPNIFTLKQYLTTLPLLWTLNPKSKTPNPEVTPTKTPNPKP